MPAKPHHERSEDTSVTAESMVSLGGGKWYKSNNDKKS